MRREAWVRALDVQMDFHKWSASDVGGIYNYYFFEDVLEKAGAEMPDPPDIQLIEMGARNLRRNLVETLWQADTMYVTSDMLQLMMAAAEDLPADAIVDEHTFVTKTGFCLFEEPIHGTDKNGENVCIDGIAWMVERVSHNLETPEDTLILYFFVDPGNEADAWNGPFRETVAMLGGNVPPITLQHFYPIKIGKTVPRIEDVKKPGTEIITQALRLFISMNLIAQQKIGTPQRLNPDRAQRKRVQRYFKGDEKLITLITLRRKNFKKDDEEPQKVEWSRRWAVRGHWRRQPDKNGWHWQYIHEYIKGPDDKPFLPPDRRIFDFRR